MNIKTKQLHRFGILFLGVLLYLGLIIAPTASALSVTELCKDKVRPQPCEQGVNETCKSRTTASSKETCQKDRAKDFQSKTAAAANNSLLSPSSPSTDGSTCGYKNPVKTRFNFDCLGDKGPPNMGPIEDLLYSLVRFLSAGIGIVVVIFIIVSGIQYSASEGNPEATQAAKNRIQNAIIGLFLYLIAFSLVQFLVPGGLFSGTVVTPETLPVIMRGIYG